MLFYEQGITKDITSSVLLMININILLSAKLMWLYRLPYKRGNNFLWRDNMKSKLFVLCVILTMVFTLFAGCGSDSGAGGGQSDEPQYCDQQFLDSFVKGLDARWTLSDKQDKEGIQSTTSTLNECIDCELNELEPYLSASFEDSKLQERAIKYINILKESKENAECMFSDDYELYSKWEDIYYRRAVMIKDFVNDYSLTFAPEHQETLDGFLTNAKNFESQQDKKAEIEGIVNNLVFAVVEDNSSSNWKDYRAVLENTTNYDIEYLSVQVNLLNGDGVIIDNTWVSAENVSKGQKVYLEFSTDKDFSDIELNIESYELN